MTIENEKKCNYRHPTGKVADYIDVDLPSTLVQFLGDLAARLPRADDEGIASCSSALIRDTSWV